MNIKTEVFRKPWIQSLIAVFVIFGSLAVILYWENITNLVNIDNSVLDAPVANIAPTAPGVLNAVFVKEGDYVAANTAVAQVGSETLFTKDDGIILGVPNVLGSYFAPGQKVLSIISNKRMRVVGAIEENKGLSRIKQGQRVIFTVDAFGNRKYEGIVDEISPASRTGDIVFSISDQRPVNKFNVYVAFDTLKYPELKTGMSARIKIFVK